jgi:hypothetical protein
MRRRTEHAFRPGAEGGCVHRRGAQVRHPGRGPVLAAYPENCMAKKEMHALNPTARVVTMLHEPGGNLVFAVLPVAL